MADATSWPYVRLASLGDLSLTEMARVKNCTCCNGLGYHHDDPNDHFHLRFCDDCTPGRLRGFPDTIVMDDNPVSFASWLETHPCMAKDMDTETTTLTTLRACWECNNAHEALRNEAGLFLCLTCGRRYRNGKFLPRKR